MLFLSNLRSTGFIFRLWLLPLFPFPMPTIPQTSLRFLNPWFQYQACTTATGSPPHSAGEFNQVLGARRPGPPCAPSCTSLWGLVTPQGGGPLRRTWWRRDGEHLDHPLIVGLKSMCRLLGQSLAERRGRYSPLPLPLSQNFVRSG
jgi:hypothetical protein